MIQTLLGSFYPTFIPISFPSYNFLSAASFGVTNNKHIKNAALAMTIQVIIGIGGVYSATIGAATLLSLPTTLVKPIARPRYSDSKYEIVAKYR